MTNDKQRIAHILEAISKINTMTVCSREEFLCSVPFRDAVSYNFLIIGEAAAQLSEELKKGHPEIPWRVIIGMRNVLIHDYVQTNYEMLWQTVKEDLPPLQKLLTAIETQI